VRSYSTVNFCQIESESTISFRELSESGLIARLVIYVMTCSTTVYTSASQPVGRDPLVGREAFLNVTVFY